MREMGQIFVISAPDVSKQHDVSAALSPVIFALFILMKLAICRQNSAQGLEYCNAQVPVFNYLFYNILAIALLWLSSSGLSSIWVRPSVSMDFRWRRLIKWENEFAYSRTVVVLTIFRLFLPKQNNG